MSDLLGRLGAASSSCRPCCSPASPAASPSPGRSAAEKRTGTVSQRRAALAGGLAAWRFTAAAVRRGGASSKPCEVGLGEGRAHRGPGRADRRRRAHPVGGPQPGTGRAALDGPVAGADGAPLRRRPGLRCRHRTPATGGVAGGLAGPANPGMGRRRAGRLLPRYNVRWVVAWSDEANARLALVTTLGAALPAEGLTLWKVPRHPRRAGGRGHLRAGRPDGHRPGRRPAGDARQAQGDGPVEPALPEGDEGQSAAYPHPAGGAESAT